MSFAKQAVPNWKLWVGVGLASTLAITGCDRKKEDPAEAIETTEQTEVVTKAVPAVACDDPMVIDRLKLALKTSLSQQAQGLTTAYANQANVIVDGNDVSSKVNNILVDIQNPSVLQATNSNGMTTCQASVSLTLPSEDLYQANQVYAASGRASLQDQLATQNISLNNNMLVDDGFSYVVGTQAGQLQTRIAGQPAMLNLVADVLAGSAVQTTLDVRRQQVAAQRARVQQQRRAEQQARRNSVQQNQPVRNTRAAEPTRSTSPTTPAQARPAPAPVQPKPATPAANNTTPEPAAKPNTSNNSSAPVDTSTPTTNYSLPTDDSIDVVIIEDENATY